WLQRELALVRPDVVVCLGATAAQALFGRGFRILEERGAWQELPDGARGFATVHPSWVLRQPAATREEAFASFRRDLGLLVAERTLPDRG
ncbi:MAG: uracil-DNA glycosylase, partial [Lysobacteraceae bacterium]